MSTLRLLETLPPMALLGSAHTAAFTCQSHVLETPQGWDCTLVTLLVWGSRGRPTLMTSLDIALRGAVCSSPDLMATLDIGFGMGFSVVVPIPQLHWALF